MEVDSTRQAYIKAKQMKQLLTDLIAKDGPMVANEEKTVNVFAKADHLISVLHPDIVSATLLSLHLVTSLTH